MEEADIARLSRATRAEIASISTLVRQPHEENVDYARRLLSDEQLNLTGREVVLLSEVTDVQWVQDLIAR